MKLAVIGGGSTYTPELFEGLVHRGRELALHEVVLHDVAPERLGPVAGFCRRMADAEGAPFQVRECLDLDEALRGAAFVILQIRVGGQAARHLDETIPLAHGRIGQETTGAGGFFKALRTVPQALHVAQRVRMHAPGAWIINFTNPSGLVTEALLHHGKVRTVGLCNIPIEMRMHAAQALDVHPELVELDYAGLNHLGWIRGVRVAGTDITAQVLAHFTGGHAPANIPDIDYPPGFIAALGMIPSPYLRYYYAEDRVLAELRAQERTRAQVVMELEERLFAIYRDASQRTKPALLDLRGGAWYSRVALDVIAGLLSPEGCREIVNTLNQGALPGLPDDAVVEIPARLSAHGIRPEACAPLPEEVAGLVRHAKAYERLAIEAAITRSRAKALAALVANPLVRTVDAATGILDAFIENGDFAPSD